MSASALIQDVVEVVVAAVAVSSEEPAGADVCGSFADDGAGVVGKAVIPLYVEAFVEAPEVVDEQAEAVVVVFGAVVEVHPPFAHGVVEVAAAEGFGVSDLVAGVA
jgi:hypothetical protein